MANGHNLFISYDLHDPGKNYQAVSEAIKGLGNWAKPNLSFWYVNSTIDSTEAAKRVWAVMDRNDRLFVLNTKNNSAAWYNIDPLVVAHLKKYWNY